MALSVFLSGVFLGWIGERTCLAAATGRVPGTTAMRRIEGNTNSILPFGTTDATIVFAARLDTLFFFSFGLALEAYSRRVGQMCM